MELLSQHIPLLLTIPQISLFQGDQGVFLNKQLNARPSQLVLKWCFVPELVVAPFPL